MTRYERDQFFESLCRLRDVYSHRDEDDRVGTMSIKEVVGWAVREMLALGPVEATAPAQANERKV